MTVSPFVSTEWLAEHLFDTDLRIVDGSWYMPAMNRDPDDEYRSAHIPGAVRFNPDVIADTTIPLPHMLASPEAFAAAVGALGIAETDAIVVYDGAGLFSAARVWWNFLIMGATHVHVLEGGLPKWVSETRPLAQGEMAPPPVTFRPSFDAASVVDVPKVLAALKDSISSGRRRARRSAFSWRSARTSPRPCLGPYARREKPSLHRSGRGRAHAPACRSRQGLCRRRHRSRQTGHHLVRIGRDRPHRLAGHGCPRTKACGRLRRIVDRVGRPRRPAGRHRSLERFQQKWIPLLRFESATKQ